MAWMLLLALLAATAAPQAPPSTGPLVRQAQATVRIVAGARITSDELPRDSLVRETVVRSADGSEVQTKLVEFP
jgi:hypothetical protein